MVGRQTTTQSNNFPAILFILRAGVQGTTIKTESLSQAGMRNRARQSRMQSVLPCALHSRRPALCEWIVM